jgi:hypothetical protein
MGDLSLDTVDTSLHYCIENNLNLEEMMLVLEERLRKIKELHRALAKYHDAEYTPIAPEEPKEVGDHYLKELNGAQSRFDVCYEKYVDNYKIVLIWEGMDDDDEYDPALDSLGMLTTLKQQIDESLNALGKMPDPYEHDHESLKEFAKEPDKSVDWPESYKKSIEKLMDIYRNLDTQYGAFKKQFMYYPEDPNNK